MPDNADVPPLGQPLHPASPLFVYGILRPGQLAFPLLEKHVSRHRSGRARGVLWLRDGLPLFDPDSDGAVAGDVLWLEPDDVQAWAIVREIEPSTQYQWGEVQVQVQDQLLVANVLKGRRIGTGTAGEPIDEWSAANDPVFVEGLNEVRTLVMEVASEGVDSRPDTPEMWHQFFRLQAAYLLLWSVVERYTALRFGPLLAPNKRIVTLDKDEEFRAAVISAGAVPDEVVDSRDPEDSVPLRADGSGAARYYYQVRSNLSHRGKSAWRDADLVYKSVTELHETMRLLLAEQLPPLTRRIAVLVKVVPDVSSDDVDEEDD